MPPFNITTGVRNLLSQWGAITSAASQRLGVSGAWQAVRTALGVTEGHQVQGFASIQDMNTVYGLAVGNREAAAQFSSASPESVVLGNMIGSTPNARSLDVQDAAPLYNVRVPYTYTEGGTTLSDYVTVQVPQSLDSFTVGSLTDLVTTLATTIVTGYGRTTLSFGTPQITAA